MALAARQDRAQAASIANSFSHVAAAAAASMTSFLPHRILLHHGSCKATALPPPSVCALIPLNNMDSPQLDVDQAYVFHNESSLPYLQINPVQRIGAGLANLGNTCFLNSVLQCLTYTPPLAAHLQGGFHESSCHVIGFCAMCALERHVREALTSNERTVYPNYLVKNLRCISRSFQMWRQEDAHEYMRYLIEALQKCCSVESPGGKSLIQSVFGGRLRSQVKCTQCSHCSNTYDPFLDLSLEVVRGVDSLQKALAHFTAIEILDGDNKYHCSHCKTKVRALKQFTIDQAPPVMTVQFKRFSSSGGYGGKIDKKIHFESTLDLKPFVNGCEDEELKYSLYAVLVHSGWSTHSGHYYCFVRTATDTWHVMDDSQVSQVSERVVFEQKAYILFYIRDTKTTPAQGNTFLDKSSMVPPTTSDLQVNVYAKIEEDGVSSKVSSIESELQEKGELNLVLEMNKVSVLETNKVSGLNDLTDVNESLNVNQATVAAVLNGFSESSQYKTVQIINRTGLMDANENVNDATMASVLNSNSESSWYKAVQIINSLCVEMDTEKEDQAQEFTCSKVVQVASDNSQMTGKGSYVDQDVCRGDFSQHFEDEKSGGDNDELPILQLDQKQSRCSLFNVAAPLMRNTIFETAGHHALSILCMCAKFCFWSCFWSPL